MRIKSGCWNRLRLMKTSEKYTVNDSLIRQLECFCNIMNELSDGRNSRRHEGIVSLIAVPKERHTVKLCENESLQAAPVFITLDLKKKKTKQ